jgi:hypothetical protein
MAQCEAGFRFITETPGFHSSGVVQTFIEQEVMKPSKAWVQEVVGNKREMEAVKLRTPEFVLLPDLNPSRRQHQQQLLCTARNSQNCGRQAQRWQHKQAWAGGGHKTGWQSGWGHASCPFSEIVPSCPPTGHLSSGSSAAGQPRFLNWLAIVSDPSVRSVRDLRSEHIGMLERLYDQCVLAIQKEFKVERHDIMVFANYPPSVYKLHFHFCAPFFTSSAYDAFRMHPLSNIINNLRLCPDYYKLSSFQVPVHVGSELFRVANARREECEQSAIE